LGEDILQTQGGGFFIQPTIVDNPKDDSKIAKKEPFRPLVPLLRWSDEEEVIARANDSDAGCGACQTYRRRAGGRKCVD